MIQRILICLIVSLSCAAAQARDLQGEIPRLADGLLSEISTVKGKRMAVGEFKDSEGRVTQLSGLISETFEVGLVNHAQKEGFEVVNRRNVSELAQEWKLGMTGAVDSASARQAGKLLGVDVFCLGSYTEAGKKIEIRATLVDAETGKILSAASGDFKADDDVKELADKIIKQADAPPASSEDAGTLKVEVWSDHKEFVIGEKVIIHAKVNQDCYLTLIDVGTNGDATVIFPNEYEPSNAVKAGVTYTIPDPSASFDFQASGPAGTEIVRAIASKAPAVDLKDAMAGFSANKAFGGVKNPPAMARDIHIKAKQSKKGEWSDATLTLAIREAGQ